MFAHHRTAIHRRNRIIVVLPAIRGRYRICPVPRIHLLPKRTTATASAARIIVSDQHALGSGGCSRRPRGARIMTTLARSGASLTQVKVDDVAVAVVWVLKDLICGFSHPQELLIEWSVVASRVTNDRTLLLLLLLLLLLRVTIVCPSASASCMIIGCVLLLLFVDNVQLKAAGSVVFNWVAAEGRGRIPRLQLP